VTPELEAYLAERFRREREATLNLVVGVIERMLNEQIPREREATLGLVKKLVEGLLRELIRRDGEVTDQWFARLQSLIDQMRDLVEQRARLDSAAPVVDNSVKVN
jgi:hypothetical protein